MKKTGWHWALALALGFAPQLLSQAPLVRAKTRMSDSIGRTQGFVCTVSIERTVKRGSAATALPPLQVDTGVIDGKELYERPAEPALAILQDVFDQLTSAGAGSYALYARPVFQTGVASFYDNPEETRKGKRVLRWDFRVVRESSRYTLNNKGTKVVAGYSGTMWVDPETFDTVALQLQSDELPPEAGIKSAAQTFEYARVQIATIDVLLPASSELVIKEGDGSELRLAERYGDCRKFTTKNVKNLLDLAPATVGAAVAVGEAEAAATAGSSTLPNGLRLATTIETPIDERTTAVGDTVVFKVTSALKAKDGGVLVAKGAVMNTKVTRISQQVYRTGSYWKRYYLVGLQAQDIDIGGKKAPLVANLEILGPTAALSIFLPLSQDPGKWGEQNSPNDYTDTAEVRDRLQLASADSGESLIGLWREYLRIPRGIRAIWSTGHPPKR